MDYKPLKHNFTKTDINQINKIGYQVQGSGNTSFVTFMKKYFPNFNLVSLLEVVENQFTPTSQTAITRKIHFDDASGVLKIEYTNQFENQDDALLFVREFTNKNGITEVKHEYCVIPRSSRNNGLIKPVFRESLQQYVNINAKRILVHAALSGGGYTWAKHGFVATDKK